MIRPLLDPAFVVLVVLLGLALVVAGGVFARRGHRLAWVLRGSMVLLLALVALRPGIGTAVVPGRSTPIEVLVVVDRTTSMSAEDWYDGRPRLEGVRRDITELVESMPNGRFTVMTFGSSVHLLLPSTQDATFIEQTVALLDREAVLAGTGSRLDRPLPHLRRQLVRMKRQTPDRPRVLVLMSDGENTDERRQRSFAPIAGLVDEGLVLGYGTLQGGPMRLDESDAQVGWVPDPATGSPAVSRIDQINLREVAQELGLTYLHRERPGELSESTRLWQEDFAEDDAGADESLPAQHELYWLAALALLALGLVELRTHWRASLRDRRALR
jgi:Ca-activated chloride channel family protein